MKYKEKENYAVAKATIPYEKIIGKFFCIGTTPKYYYIGQEKHKEYFRVCYKYRIEPEPDDQWHKNRKSIREYTREIGTTCWKRSRDNQCVSPSNFDNFKVSFNNAINCLNIWYVFKGKEYRKDEKILKKIKQFIKEDNTCKRLRLSFDNFEVFNVRSRKIKDGKFYTSGLFTDNVVKK